MKHLIMLVLLVVASLAQSACYKCEGQNCSNIPPEIQPDYPADGNVEEYPDDSAQAASSPCGRACVNLRAIHCSDGEPTKGVSCYRACVKAARLRRLPVTCWTVAKSVGDARACGAIRCKE